MPEMKKQSKQWIKNGQLAQSRQVCMPAEQSRCYWYSLTAKADVHPHRAQGHQHQRHLHPQGLKQVPSASEEEEARDGPVGMVVPLGQCTRPHCRKCEEVIC